MARKTTVKNEQGQQRKLAPNPLLKAAREKCGWTQSELGEMIGTNFVAISRWEKGVNFPSSYHRHKLCEVFNKTLAELGLIPPEDSSSTLVLPPEAERSRIIGIPPQRNQYFTGREDLLAMLHQRLSATGKAALTQPQALHGLGGIGKTQSAVEYAFRYGEDYAFVCWIRAATRETLIADFVTLAQALDLARKDEQQDQLRIVSAVKDWLAAHAGWLVILDNADDLPLTQEFLPISHNGYLLFTTKAQAAGNIAASIEVEKLNVHDGSVLLLRWSNLLAKDAPLDQARAADRDAAARIVKIMDGLPLALVQAGAYVNETGCSLRDYLGFYASHRKELLAQHSQFLRDYPGTVATTWSLSFREIEQQSSLAADVLRFCAFLAADAIPEELLLRGAAVLDTLPGASTTDEFSLNEALRVLRLYSLVRRDADTHMLSIHRLVQTVLKENMDQETQHTWAERTVRLVNAAFPEGDYGAGTNSQYYLQYYVPHIQECATLIEQYQINTTEAAQLLYHTGAFLYVHGLYAQSQSLHKQALTIRKQVFGPDHPDVAESLNVLAIIARYWCDYQQAEELHLQAMTIREQSLGPQHCATAESLNNLGVLYRTQEKYEQAEPLLQRALVIREQLLGSEHLDTLNSLINLSKLYIEQRKYERARPLLQQTLATFEKKLDSSHPRIAQNLHLLARLSYEQGNYKEAEEYWKRSREMIEKTLGFEHPALAESLDAQATLYFAQGRYEQAQVLCQRAFSICEKVLGPEHPDTITYREHLSRILSKRETEQEVGQPPAPSA